MVAAISPGARAALLALSSVRGQIDALQTRLATGRRVNSALDNPTAFFMASGLSSRASSINALMSGISSTQGAISAANNGITAIKSLLATAQTVANQALQTTQSLLTVNSSNSSPLLASTQIASTAGGATEFKAGDVVTVSDGTTTATYTAADGDTLQTFLNTVNGTAGLNITASLNADGQIELAGTSNVDITVGGFVTGTGTIPSVLSFSPGTTNYQTNTVRSTLATQFNNLMTQIDQIAADSGFNGLNFLTGSTSAVTLNETGTSTLTITGSSATSSGLGIGGAANMFQLDTDISAAMTEIGTALGSLQAISTSMGSMASLMQTRVDFNQSMIDTLDSGADALTVNDPDEDSAILLALQTRQKLVMTSLSLASSSDSAALRLFDVD
jgi:flagellin-like hook-associated protein FlgL